ncbi:MAG: PD40 domain-containing protein [Planctomycetes bacterium]|nr:PD40 domain-containing protein [Planctomycetota bacterium]
MIFWLSVFVSWTAVPSLAQQRYELRVALQDASRFAKVEGDTVPRDILWNLDRGPRESDSGRGSEGEPALPSGTHAEASLFARRLWAFADRALSADGKLLVFSKDVAGDRELFTCMPDGSGEERLTEDPARDVQPSWSMDRKRVVFCREVGDLMQPFVVDVREKVSRRLLVFDGQVRMPHFVPGNRGFVCLVEPADRKRRGKLPPLRDLIHVEREGAEPRVVLAAKSIWDHAVSPDGTRVVVSIDSSVLVIDLASGAILLDRSTRQIDPSAHAHTARSFCWRPDGGVLAFHLGFLGGRMAGTVMRGDHEVYVLELDEADDAAVIGARVRTLSLGAVCKRDARLVPRIIRWERRR